MTHQKAQNDSEEVNKLSHFVVGSKPQLWEKLTNA